MSKSIKNILNSKKFLLGFEVEFIYDENKIGITNLRKELTKIHHKIILSDDGSVEPDGRLDLEYDSYCNGNERTGEIQTPPLPPSQSFSVLKRVFNLVDKYGYTNESCGFHLNFSPVSDKLFNSINPFKFTSAGLWAKIKRAFGRENNEYCMDVWQRPYKPMNKLQQFLQLSNGYCYDYPDYSISSGKEAAVNFENYFMPKRKDSRVEVRAFGGEAYHRKLTTIKKYAGQILNTYLKYCEV